MAEQNYERRFGKAPVKEDVGVFTADMVARVRKPEPCGQHEGPWDWTPVRLAPSMTVGHLQARSQDGPMKMDMRRVDCKLNRDLESRSLEDLEMVRGEFKSNWVARLGTCEITRIEYGRNMAGLL